METDNAIGQLIKYNTRNTVFENSYTKCGIETLPRLFYKTSNGAYLVINCIKLYAVFLLYTKLRAIEIY